MPQKATSLTGLYPASRRKEFDELCSVDNWIALPPRPRQEQHRFRGRTRVKIRHRAAERKRPVTAPESKLVAHCKDWDCYQPRLQNDRSNPKREEMIRRSREDAIYTMRKIASRKQSLLELQKRLDAELEEDMQKEEALKNNDDNARYHHIKGVHGESRSNFRKKKTRSKTVPPPSNPRATTWHDVATPIRRNFGPFSDEVEQMPHAQTLAYINDEQVGSPSASGDAIRYTDFIRNKIVSPFKKSRPTTVSNLETIPFEINVTETAHIFSLNLRGRSSTKQRRGIHLAKGSPKKLNHRFQKKNYDQDVKDDSSPTTSSTTRGSANLEQFCEGYKSTDDFHEQVQKLEDKLRSLGDGILSREKESNSAIGTLPGSPPSLPIRSPEEESESTPTLSFLDELSNVKNIECDCPFDPRPDVILANRALPESMLPQKLTGPVWKSSQIPQQVKMPHDATLRTMVIDSIVASFLDEI